MKKYNKVFVWGVMIYVVLAAFLWWVDEREDNDRDNLAQVQINRIYQGLAKAETFVKPDLRSYDFIEEVSYLAASEDKKEIVHAFYKKKSGIEMSILPCYKGDQVTGYIRFDYVQPVKERSGFYAAQLALFLMLLLTLGVGMYLKYVILKPFQVLQNMPYELAKGHLKMEVKENEGRYFGKFVWGINMLRDNIEAHRKKELRLEKEKKLLLLSISHDVKTPLNAIKLYTKALQENVYDTEEQEVNAMAQIQDKAVEIENFIKEIVRTSMEDIVEIQIQPGEFYLEQLVQALDNMYRERCDLQKLNFHIAAFENRLIDGDLDRAIEVCENIMGNAIKYGDGKDIHIYFYEEDYCQLICFQNTGTRVSSHEMVHLFDSFFRGSHAQGKEGSGLGLYICKEIMKKMDGDVFARKWEEGMEFVVVLR